MQQKGGKLGCLLFRAVASLTVPGGQEFHFPHFLLKFRSIYLVFPQTLLIFFLILVLRVGGSPTREGPGYATATVPVNSLAVLFADTDSFLQINYKN